MRRFVTVIALSVSTLVTPVAAEELRRSIPVSPSDLSDPVAAAALYARVVETATALCAKANPPIAGYAPTARTARRECVADSVARAVDATRSPQLASVHAQVLAENRPAPVAATLASR
ncbi:MAG: UrcA family protein [Hyphomonadaceae bacterium]|nr:UrcA family protein [Hyphomonadaceae bacterium]